MHIIARKTLILFWQRFPESEQSLKAWFAEAEKAQWKTPSQIKESYRSASILKNNRGVFNICGNKFRLIVRINYLSSTAFIRFVGTHEEYDKINSDDI